jgi:hypothetical protein
MFNAAGVPTVAYAHPVRAIPPSGVLPRVREADNPEPPETLIDESVDLHEKSIPGSLDKVFREL